MFVIWEKNHCGEHSQTECGKSDTHIVSLLVVMLVPVNHTPPPHTHYPGFPPVCGIKGHVARLSGIFYIPPLGGTG